MSRYEKGILGYRKDPKNQILFSFGVREGEEWPSDDSDDSDYTPTKKKKQALQKAPNVTKQMGKRRKRPEKGRNSVDSSESDTAEYTYSNLSNKITEDLTPKETGMSEIELAAGDVNDREDSHSQHSLPVKTSTQSTNDLVFSSSSSDNQPENVSQTHPVNCVQPSPFGFFQSEGSYIYSESSASRFTTSDDLNLFHTDPSTCTPDSCEASKNSTSSIHVKGQKERLPGKEKKKRKKSRRNDASYVEPGKKRRRKKEKQSSKEPNCEHKISKGPKKVKRLDEETTEEVEGSPVTKKGSSSAQNLAPEILLKIFKYAVLTDGAVPFLCRAARVCSLWYHTSCNPSLWLNVDLSYGWIRSQEKYLVWLTTHRIPLCTSINLSSWKLLTNNGIRALAENCPNLSTVNLSYCPKITSKAVQALADHCRSLARIDLSSTSTEAVSQASLKYLIERVGGSLTHLTLGSNALKGFNSVLNSIASFCPQLQFLDVSNVFFSSDYLSLNVEKFQEGCPNMKALRFVNSKVRANQATQRQQVESPGFPALEELSIAVNTNKNTYRLAMDGDVLSRMLKNSTDLKTLDVRGWSFYSFRSLIHIPTTGLEQLLLSQNHVAITEDFGFDLLMMKWRHSLVEVDLSWNSYRDNVLDMGIQLLTEYPDQCKVEVLDLAGTNVECSTVKTILNGCPRLRAMNLSSCRSLPRGIKREFEGKELEQLRKAVDNFDESGS